MAIDHEEIALATCNFFQTICDSLSGEDKKEHGNEEALVLGKYCLSCPASSIFVLMLITRENKNSTWYSCSITKNMIPHSQSKTSNAIIICMYLFIAKFLHEVLYKSIH